MSDQPAGGQAQRVRNYEYLTAIDGTQFKRKVKPDGTHMEWVPISPDILLEEQPPSVLMLVLEKQAEGEPKHWHLFVSFEGKPGSVYQVTGDATFMRHEFQRNSSPLISESFHASYVLAQLEEGQEDIVRSCARMEAPPSAENRAAVKENCQGWVIRVLQRLREAEIVSERWLKFAEGLEEPV